MEADPIRIETCFDGPVDEFDRLLDLVDGPESQVLDIGCGAGFQTVEVLREPYFQPLLVAVKGNH
jgi:hypothetical protein